MFDTFGGISACKKVTAELAGMMVETTFAREKYT